VKVIVAAALAGEPGIFALSVLVLAALFGLGVVFAVGITITRCLYNMPSQWLGRPTGDQWLGKRKRRHGSPSEPRR
jgi:hypothetical protein